jgi:hypothetical protein
MPIPMAYFIVQAIIFALGGIALIIGKIPMSRRRFVQGSAARIIGLILMIPLPLYIVACRQSHAPLLGIDDRNLDPLMPHTEGFIRLVAMAATFACLLAATVLALVTSETRRRP